MTPTSTLHSRFDYAGQYTDAATGLIYMRARWYDPATGAFITSDPLGHASGETNLYHYANGDPTNIVDPSGLFGLADVSDAAAGFGDRVTGLVSSGVSALTAGSVNLPTTADVRRALGADYVNYCSSAYRAGERTGLGIAAATGALGAAGVAGSLAPVLLSETAAMLPIRAAGRRVAAVLTAGTIRFYTSAAARWLYSVRGQNSVSYQLYVRQPNNHTTVLISIARRLTGL